MASQNFIDRIRVFCRSGHGGAGSAHLRHEKFVPKGGPDGGDGGKGGDVIMIGNKNKWTLLHLQYCKHVVAKNGEAGGRQRSQGAKGEDSIIEVPLGTVAINEETGEQIGEITEDGQTLVLKQGGRGGLGNWNFRSPTQQTPRFSQPGELGAEGWVVLELKTFADVGLIGFPNAGKSTLLSQVSNAKPKIADYPFTTLVPELGIVSYRDGLSFVMADIPGIIVDAHAGRGIGLRFLRHTERNSILLFLVAADSDDIETDYNTLCNEIRLYKPELLEKRKALAISKVDLIDQERREQIAQKLELDLPFVFISAITGEGLMSLKDLLWKLLHEDEK